MQRLRILVILILLSLMPLYSLAVLNEGQYAFRSLDINNGLSQNTVHAILQDKQGFMWFGTKDGLDRYDGISFRTFMKESGTLGNNFITSLYEDNLGQIWIGTDVGLYVYCPQMEKVRHFTLISNPNIDIDCTVNLITGDQKGGIWVVTQTRGIFYYNPADRHSMVPKKVGMGTTMNLATPVGKGSAILGAVVLMVTIPAMCIWLILDEFTPIRLAVEDEILYAKHLNVDYEIHVEDIEHVEKITELPSWSKSSGTAMDTLEKGTFFIRNVGKCEVFLNPENTEFLHFSADGTDYYMSGSDDAQTEEIYQIIQNRE